MIYRAFNFYRCHKITNRIIFSDTYTDTPLTPSKGGIAKALKTLFYSILQMLKHFENWFDFSNFKSNSTNFLM